MANRIHQTAIVHEGAIIGDDCEIGAYSVIGPKVVIGDATRVGSHVVIEGNTRIGNENNIFQFASVGAIPQDLKYKGEDSLLEIGHRNIIREYVTLQPGTEGGGMQTRIGDKNLFMACSHIGHDSIVGSANVIANSAAISGHVEIGDGVIIGGLCGIHQFVRLGDMSFLGAGAMVAKDIPPYFTAQGDRAKLVGLNIEGLKRNGYSKQDIKMLRQLYRELFYTQGVLSNKLDIQREACEGHPVALKVIDFIKSSQRGIAFPRKKSSPEDLDEE